MTIGRHFALTQEQQECCRRNLVSLVSQCLRLKVVNEMLSDRTIPVDGGQRRLQEHFVVLKKPSPQFANTQGRERERRRGVDCDLSIDVRRQLLGRSSTTSDPSPDLPITLAVVHPP